MDAPIVARDVTQAVYPIVARPLEACAWCWGNLHPGQPYPNQSSGICPEHVEWMLQQSAARRQRRAEQQAWTECREAFLRSIEDRSGSARSANNYRTVLRAFFCDENKSPADYTRSDVERFINAPSRARKTLGQPITPGARNVRLATLASFYKYASTYELEDGTPIFQKKAPTTGIAYIRKAEHPVSLSYEEFEKLFAVIPTDTITGLRDRALFLTYFWTARRKSEIARLCWGDIEASTIVEENGKRRAGYVYHFSAKGKSRERLTAELPLPAYQAIYRYLEFSGRIETIQKEDPLFLPTHPGGCTETDYRHRPLSGVVIYCRFKAYARRAGLDPRITIHSLRHMAAQQRHKAGQDVLSIQSLLGHASLDMTWHYLQTLNGLADNGASLLEAKFGKFSGGQGQL